MALPDWLPHDLNNAKLETVGPRIKLRGHDAEPDRALHNYRSVLLFGRPPGYVLSRSSIEAEHGRGKRLCWEVVWLREEVAERRYKQSQEKLMSRFAHEETTT